MTRIDKYWMGPNQQWLVIWSMTYSILRETICAVGVLTKILNA